MKKKMSEWLPIETAPKDGTDILVHYDKDYNIVYWSEDLNSWSLLTGGRALDKDLYGWYPIPPILENKEKENE